MLILNMILRITGYTQEKLANYLNVSRASINSWLSDDSNMSEKSKRDICDVFHIPYLKKKKKKGYEVHVASKGNQEIPYCDKKIVIPFERSPYKLNNLKAIKQLRKVINEERLINNFFL